MYDASTTEKTKVTVGLDLGDRCCQICVLDEAGEVTEESKAGDDHLRWLLVSAAHYILGPFGPDSDLRRWGLALAAQGGRRGKKRAVVAVARKLSVLLLRLWRTGEVYEPLRNLRLRGETVSTT